MDLSTQKMDDKIKIAIEQAILNMNPIEATNSFERQYLQKRISEISSFIISSIEDLDTSDLNETFEESEEN